MDIPLLGKNARVSDKKIAGLHFLNVVRVVWLREILIYFRDRPRVISAFMMPIVMLILFGEGLGGIIELPGISYRQFIFPGMVAMIVLMNSIFAGVTIVTDRQFGFLREMLVAPVSRTAIAVAKIFGGATIALINGVVLFAFAPLMGIDISFLIVVKLMGLILLVGFMLTGIGVSIGSRLRTPESFQMLSQAIIFPAMFLSGVFFPVNNTAKWLDFFVQFNPITYAVAPIREIGLGNELEKVSPEVAASLINIQAFGHTFTILEELGVVVGFSLLMLWLAVRGVRNAS